MDPITRRAGSWTISHVPAGHSAYDRVLGRLTAWCLVVEHDSGWQAFQYEGSPEAQIVTPGGLLVGVIDPTDFAAPPSAALAGGRSELLMQALTVWVHQHAEDYGERDIPH